MHAQAFANMGLLLPLNGRRDGDLDTLSLGHGRRLIDGDECPTQRAVVLRQSWSKVPNPSGTIDILCPHTPKSLDVDWTHLLAKDQVQEQVDPKLHSIQRALRKWNRNHIECFKSALARDITDRTEPLPVAGCALELADVMAMSKMFNSKFGTPHGEKKLFCDILGLPTYTAKGDILFAARKGATLVNWKELSTTSGACIAKDAAIRRVLMDVDALNARATVSIRQLTVAGAVERVSVERDIVAMLLHQQRLPNEWQRMKSAVYVRTLWKPSAGQQPTAEQLTRLNESRMLGIELGFTWEEYSVWYNRLQREVEERMLDVVGQRGVSLKVGMFNAL